MSTVIDTLVTDRSLADVEQWQQLKALGWPGMTAEQQELWSSGAMKGAYNASDLNRVIEAVNYLNGLFQSAGYYPPVEPQTPNWVVGQVPTTSQMQTYLSNVQALRDRLAASFSTELPTSMALLTYAGANSIEQVLTEIDIYLTVLSAIFLRAGMAWAVSGGPGFYFAN